MARWEPDAPGRLTRAALDLYLERGFEATTVADIADRAGVSERTFFRHFADKREVLFDGSQQLERSTLAAIADAPAESSPWDIAGNAVVSATSVLDGRQQHARRRAEVIAATPSLQERELLKMAKMAAAAAQALRDRGVPDLTARLAAQSAVTAFSAGFAGWIADEDGPSLADHVRAALDELRALAARTTDGGPALVV